MYFYPRSPCGERRTTSRITKQHFYFYPRSPCGERRRVDFFFLCCIIISIHALLAESDKTVSAEVGGSNHFYPRSPCGERLKKPCIIWSLALFLSTLSLRRATHGGVNLLTWQAYFYPRSPCGERRTRKEIADAVLNISIHALLAESDAIGYVMHNSWHIFLSTLSLRRATISSFFNSPISHNISIHALLAESDLLNW